MLFYCVWSFTMILCSFFMITWKCSHRCLLCNKARNFFTLTTILHTLIISYFNVFASCCLLSIYYYKMDINSHCRTFSVSIVVKCSDSCGGCSCTMDVWACTTVSTFATLLSTSGPKPFVLCSMFLILPHLSEEPWHHQSRYNANSEARLFGFESWFCHLTVWCPWARYFSFQGLWFFSTLK